MKISLLLLLFFLKLIPDCFTQCNGSNDLCSRRYNEVSFLTTHNAFNCSADEFMLPNQSNTITQQLMDGVRALMIDVYDVSGVPTVYHGFPYLGTKTLAYELQQIKTFLDNNPNEIITIIFESYITAPALEASLDSSGLKTFLFAKDQFLPWPTLQEMIDSEKRLVVFSEADNAESGQDWYHYIWKYAVETEFSIHDTSEFTSNYNRGDSLNELFILNHFITNSLTGTGSSAEALKANSNPFLLNRVKKVMSDKNKFPNFLALDFYEIGDGMDVENTLNSLNWAGVEQASIVEKELNIWPVPSNDVINIRTPDKKEYEDVNLVISNAIGQKVYSCDLKNGYAQICLPDNLLNGVYFITIYGRDKNLITSGKFLSCD